MKLREVRALIADAVTRDQPTPAVVLWLDRLRMRGWPPVILPFTYDDLLAFVRDSIPGLDRAAWDAFLAKCDELDSEVSRG